VSISTALVTGRDRPAPGTRGVKEKTPLADRRSERNVMTNGEDT